MKISEMNKHQRVAFYQVVHASNWVVGGYENSVQDGNMQEMPSRDQLAEEIYDTVMTCTTLEGFQSFSPVKEVRFAGTDFIKERIDRRLKKMGYDAE